MSRERTVWTRQHPAVLEEPERCGRYMVKEEAIMLSWSVMVLPAKVLSSIRIRAILSPSSLKDRRQLDAVVHLSSPPGGYGSGHIVGAAPGVDRSL